MTDIIERAEDFFFHTPYAPLPRHMSEQLVKELKTARAELVKVKTQLASYQSIAHDPWERTPRGIS